MLKIRKPNKPRPHRVRRLLRQLAQPEVMNGPFLAASLALFSLDSLPIFFGEAFDGTKTQDSIVAIIAAVVSSIGLFAYWGLAQRIYLKRPSVVRHPAAAVWTVFVASNIGDALAQLAVSATGVFSGDLLKSSLDHGVYQTIALALIASVTNPLASHRQSVQSLYEIQAQLLSTRPAGQQALASERGAVVARISDLVERTLNVLQVALPNESIAALRGASEDVVRPLSHHLASEKPDFEPPAIKQSSPPQWRSVLSNALSTPLIQPFTMAATVTLLASRLTITSGNEDKSPQTIEFKLGALTLSLDFTRAGIALIELVVILLSTWAAAELIARISRSRLRAAESRQRWLISVMSLVAISLVAQVLVMAAFSYLRLPEIPQVTALTHILFVLPLVIISAGIGAFRVIQLRRAAVLEELTHINSDLKWEVAKINEELWQERRTLSRWLHGPVQAALQAGVIQLESDLQTTGVSEDSIESVRANVRAALLQVDEPQELVADFEGGVDSVKRLWAGVCSIHLEIEEGVRDRLVRDVLCASSVVELLGEACANAAIHGGATQVNASLQLQAQRLLKVEVTNNGPRMHELKSTGLGGQILDEITLEWGLEFGPTGARLTAVMPLA